MIFADEKDHDAPVIVENIDTPFTPVISCLGIALYL